MRVNRGYKTYIFIGNLGAFLLGYAYGITEWTDFANGLDHTELLMLCSVPVLLALITKMVTEKSEEPSG